MASDNRFALIFNVLANQQNLRSHYVLLTLITIWLASCCEQTEVEICVGPPAARVAASR
jgi:hypothetical protein